MSESTLGNAGSGAVVEGKVGVHELPRYRFNKYKTSSVDLDFKGLNKCS